jgi:hypothetical protein
MLFQQITLLATSEPSGAVGLPVGVVVRDPATGDWRRGLLAVPEAATWQETLAGLGDALPGAVVASWAGRGGAMMGAVDIAEIEARDLAHALDVAEAELMGRYAVTVEEM